MREGGKWQVGGSHPGIWAGGHASPTKFEGTPLCAPGAASPPSLPP